MGIEVYSQTPASNDLANYFQTGMAPSKVKNAGWDIMADMAQQLLGMPTTGGTANAQTATNTRQFASLVAGMMQYVVFGATNTAAMTFAPDGLTAKNVFTNGAAILAGQAVSGQIGILKYDGTQWNLLNPSRATGSFTGTIATGLTTTPTGTVTYAVGQDGKTAYVSFPTITATASASVASMTMTGVPPILTTSSSQRVWCATEDATGVPGSLTSLVTNTSTTWNFAQNVNGSGGYTLSGTRGVLACETSFTLS